MRCRTRCGIRRRPVGLSLLANPPTATPTQHDSSHGAGSHTNAPSGHVSQPPQHVLRGSQDLPSSGPNAYDQHAASARSGADGGAAAAAARTGSFVEDYVQSPREPSVVEPMSERAAFETIRVLRLACETDKAPFIVVALGALERLVARAFIQGEVRHRSNLSFKRKRCGGAERSAAPVPRRSLPHRLLSLPRPSCVPCLLACFPFTILCKRSFGVCRSCR